MSFECRIVAAVAALSIACGGLASNGTERVTDGATDGAEGAVADEGDAVADADAASAVSDGGPDATEEADGAADAGVDATVDALAPDGAAPDATNPDAMSDAAALDAAIDGTAIDGAAVDAATDASADAAIEASDAASSPNLPLGSDCTADTDCASAECLAVFPAAPAVCVTSCTTQADCAATAGFFCDPVTAGASSGYCVPHSPESCASCASDADCGSLSESCFQAPGDGALACNIDCSLSPADACPPDYTCTNETVNGNARMLCRPMLAASCADALGGYCDRVTAPQACQRTNAAGTCVSERDCDESTSRFDACAAATPSCKTDCSVQDPTGCTEVFCASATMSPLNCGTCGNTCPGYLQTNDNVTCQSGTTCTFSCQGENYDVDGAPSNGCEASDSPTGNHTESSPVDVGPVTCDPNGGPDIAGTILSDTRVHEDPAIPGFDPTTGTAPDWYVIEATGGPTCADDLALTLVVTGASSPDCYELTVITDVDTFTAQTDGTGTAAIAQGAGAYSDGTAIELEVQKTCPSPTGEIVSYTVTGHL
jgi:hypothetical protein